MVDHDEGGRGADDADRARSRRARNGARVLQGRGPFLAAGLAQASVLVGAALIVLGATLSFAPRPNHGLGLDLPLHTGTSVGSTADVTSGPGRAASTSGRTTAPATGPDDAVLPAAPRAGASSSGQRSPRGGVPPPHDTGSPAAEPPPVTAPPADEPPRSDPAEPPPDEHAGPESVALPIRVEIAHLDVRSDLIDLDLDARGHLKVPQDPALAGWWIGGPRPGEEGAAVIVGHVDSAHGPAVFHGLPRLEPGDTIVVHRADETEVRFAVERVERWPKDAFPTDAVYREADGAELRLITCGGRFDRRASRYLDNVIVFAREGTADRIAP
jgi:hypothetical protein